MQIVLLVGGVLIVIQLVGRFLSTAHDAHLGARSVIETVDPVNW